MTDIPKLRVKEMPRTSLIENASIVEMEFKSADGRFIVLEFGVNDLDRFVARAHQNTHQARTKNARASGHLSVGIEPVARVRAQSGIGGQSVVLGILTTASYPVHYGLPLEGAEALLQELESSIADARKQASQTRQ